MATLINTRNAIDAFLTNKSSLLTTRQEAWRTANGRYWQGLWTHTSAPTHTNATDGSAAPTSFSSSPTDQIDRWLDRFNEWAAENMPCRVRIDVYQAPNGHGWTVTVQMIHTGQTWTRVVHMAGPQTSRERAWVQGE